MDQASAQGAGEVEGAVYGLNHTQESQGQRSRVSLRGKIERAEREVGPKPEAWKYGGRKKHVPGKLSEEERRQRLSEMARDAAEHEQQRHGLLRRAGDRDAWEEARDAEASKAARGDGRGPSFLDAASKGFYGPGGDADGSLGKALNRRAFFSEKSRGD